MKMKDKEVILNNHGAKLLKEREHSFFASHNE